MGASAAAFMFVSAYLPTLSVTFAAIAGLFIAAAFIECGLKYAMLCYFSVSAVSLVIVPDKTLVFLFILFFGLYPLFKAWAEARRTALLEYGAKLLFFNAMLCLIYLLIRSFAELPKLPNIPFALPISIVVINLVFFVYDFGFSKLIILYRLRISRRK
jgi:hypothetical protein